MSYIFGGGVIIILLIAIKYQQKRKCALYMQLHDLKNTLTVLQSLFSLAKLKVENSEEGKTYVRLLNDVCTKACLQVNDILAPNKTYEYSLICLNDVVKSVFETWRLSLPANVKLALDLSDNEMFIWGNRLHIEQMLDNLLQNAQKALSAGGKINILCKESILQQEQLKHCLVKGASGQCIELSIEDDGVGFAPDLLKKISKPFFSAFRFGAGLGMSSVCKEVKKLKASLMVKSAQGKGSKFSVYFPQSEKVQTLEAKILIVDDDAMQRMLLKEFLLQENFEVLAAANPSEALVIFNECSNVDLLISDMLMPVMNGDELYKSLLVHNPHLKAIFLSGKKYNNVFDNAVFLEKPYKISDIKDLISCLLAK